MLAGTRLRNGKASIEVSEVLLQSSLIQLIPTFLAIKAENPSIFMVSPFCFCIGACVFWGLVPLLVLHGSAPLTPLMAQNNTDLPSMDVTSCHTPVVS